MIKEIAITKLPYIFWFLNFEKAEIDQNAKTLTKAKTEDNKDTKEEELTNYRFKKMNKILFLLCKYVPPFLFILLTFNKYDFVPNTVKLLEYIIALGFMGIFLFANRLLAFVACVALFAVGYFYTQGFYYLESVPFIIKYFFLFLIVFGIVKDFNKEAYELYFENRVVAHFSILE